MSVEIYAICDNCGHRELSTNIPTEFMECPVCGEQMPEPSDEMPVE